MKGYVQRFFTAYLIDPGVVKLQSRLVPPTENTGIYSSHSDVRSFQRLWADVLPLSRSHT